MFRLPETFALPPSPRLPHFGTFVPCISPTHMHPHLYVLRITRWRDARPSEARKQGSQAAVDSPPRPAPSPRPIPTHWFHVKQARTIPGNRESPTRARAARLSAPLRAGLRPRCARPAPCASEDDSFTTHAFHVKPMSTICSPARASAPRGLSCPRSERSLSVHSPRLLPTQNETQNTPHPPLQPLTHTHPRSTFIPVRRKRRPKGTER